jgi:DNA-binding GntR family transcriptional regulator
VTPAFDNSTLWQRVYEHLRDEIMADRLPPGTELSEVALSRELSVSRGPIREAMGRLAADGLVTVRPRRGAEVRSITPAELIDSYQVREALEVLAVRLAVPRLTEPDLARLGALTEDLAEHARRGAAREFFAASVAFHDVLCELGGNEKLVQIYRRLTGEIGRYQARTLTLSGGLAEAAREHRAILAALTERDAEAAAELVAAQGRAAARRVQELVGDAAAAERVSSAPGWAP